MSVGCGRVRSVVFDDDAGVGRGSYLTPWDVSATTQPSLLGAESVVSGCS